MSKLIELYMSHRRTGRVLLGLLIFSIVVAIVRISMPYTIIYGAERWFRAQGVETNIEDVRIRVLAGEFTLLKASGMDDRGRAFRIDKAAIFWNWSPLASKTIQVSAIEIEGVTLDVYQFADGLNIAGIKIDTSGGADQAMQPAPETEQDEPVEWAASLTTVSVSDISSCYASSEASFRDTAQEHNRYYCLQLGSLKWNGDVSFNQDAEGRAADDIPINIRGDFELQRLVIEDRLLAKTAIDVDTIEVDALALNGLNAIRIGALNIGAVRALEDEAGHKGHQASLESVRISNVQIDGLTTVSLKRLTIDEPAVTYGIDADGATNIDPWLHTGIQAADNAVPAETTGENASSALKLSVNSLVLTRPNLCYYAVSQDLNHCLQLETLDTRTVLAYGNRATAADDIPIELQTDLNIRSLHVIDNRLPGAALKIQQLGLERLRLEGLNTLTLAELNIDHLKAFEDDTANTGYIASFEKLAVGDITLKDLSDISVASINMVKPVSEVHLEADGNTNIDRWLPSTQETAAETGTSKPASDAPSVRLTFNNISVTDPDLCFRDDRQSLNYCLLFETMNWNGEIGYGRIEASLPLTTQGDFRLKKPSLFNRDLKRELVRYSALELDTLEVNGMDTKLDQARLSDYRAMQLEQGGDAYAAQYDLLQIDKLNYRHERAIDIDAVTLTGFGTNIRKEKNGEMSFAEWIPEAVTQEPAAPAKQQKTDKARQQETKTIAMRIGQLRIDNSKVVTYTDLTTEPVMEIGLRSVNFELGDIDSSQPGKDSALKLSARTLQHGTIDIKGITKPFDRKGSIDANGVIKGIDLRVLSPLTEQQIGHVISSGQLNADLEIKANEGILDSHIKTVLHQFRLKAMSSDDAKKLDEIFNMGIPVNQALKLIRSRDDSIKLDIPVTGDITSPEFDPKGEIVEATAKAITVAAVAYLNPATFAYLVGGNAVINLATAISFDPVLFEPGSGELDSTGLKTLDAHAKKMIERPEIYLTFCGLTAPADVDALFPLPSTAREKADRDAKDAAQAKPARPPLGPSQKQMLKVLAQTRQENVKEYLMEKKNIGHERIILCNPEHRDDTDAISGVEVGL